MAKKLGLTLIELLIIIATLAILASIVIPMVLGRVSFGTSPDQAMREYTHALYPESQEITVICAKRDTDGDGYIRCTATYKNTDGVRGGTIAAQCAGGLLSLGNSGCAPILFIRP